MLRRTIVKRLAVSKKQLLTNWFSILNKHTTPISDNKNGVTLIALPF
jgi:hypothetical protein